MINVACAIILKNDKILVTQRGENMSLPLKWEFPGGKVELNESAVECIKREIIEELNLEIDVLKELTPHQFNYGHFEINLIPFIAEYVSGNIVLSEHRDFKWLLKEDLIKLDWAEADVAVVKGFLNNDVC
jgi:8-oxo-dGTP diphosphatase